MKALFGKGFDLINGELYINQRQDRDENLLYHYKGNGSFDIYDKESGTKLYRNVSIDNVPEENKEALRGMMISLLFFVSTAEDISNV